MSREVKRVALDFEWPLKVTWKGFMNPYCPTKCTVCDGSGLNPETKKLRDTWYTSYCPPGVEGWQYSLTQEEVQALIDHNRLWNFTRVPLNEEQHIIVKDKIDAGGNSWLPDKNGYVPTAEEVNNWAREGGMGGHDAINQWICVRERAERLGVYGLCPICNGSGFYFCEDKYVELHDQWEKIPPPEGDGWQMWETTSEGSPISPVCNSPKELARWLAENRASAFGDSTATYEEWYEMITGCETAPSAVYTVGSGMRSGVSACSD